MHRRQSEAKYCAYLFLQLLIHVILTLSNYYNPSAYSPNLNAVVAVWRLQQRLL